jgi:hypothetical protein
MIRTFEEYTKELSEDERLYIIRRILHILTLAIGKEKSVTNKQIMRDINVNNPIPVSKELKGNNGNTGFVVVNLKTSEPRIRHMIHILRVTDTLPLLVATSFGYYISNEKEEIETYIGSIEDRLRSIYDIRRALKRQMKTWGKKPEGIQREISFANSELNY